MTHRLCLFLGLLAVGLAPTGVSAQDDEDEELRRGLIASYHASHAPEETAVRVDRTIAFAWDQRPPDPRLSQGPFTVQWRGYLLTPGPGEYRLAAHAAGDVKITLADQPILSAAGNSPQWLDAQPIELPFGWHRIQIDYASQGESPRLALFWSGPQFGWEPVSERQLYHDIDDSPSTAFERGESLAAALRCDACHAREDAGKPLPAPALDRLADNVSREWLIAWLREQPAATGEPQEASVVSLPRRRMPHFTLTEGQATAIAAYLMTKSESSPKSASPSTSERTRKTSPKKNAPKTPPPSAAQGEQLYLTMGCVACHQIGSLGEGNLFGGGDLSRIAEKRPADFFARWLADPGSINRDHRMPVFELTPEERTSLALYLGTLRGTTAEPRLSTANDEPALVREGKLLVEANRCGACHTLPGDGVQTPPATVAKLSEKSKWDLACIGQGPTGDRPTYALSAEDTQAARAYYGAVGRVAKPGPRGGDGRLVLQERNCVACHERDNSPGLAKSLANVISAYPDLAPRLPALTPPPLVSVGDKLHEQALVDAIRRTGGVHRPWLEVRMPKFNLSNEELEALLRHFLAQDRIPPRDTMTPGPGDSSAATIAAGARLVTADGFGCVSCHRIGTVEPEKAPLNARGPDLSLLSRRIRHEWFERWVRNPARIVPRMEMPAVQLPVRGVLDDDLNQQLAAVWQVLNTPGFEPPPPNPVRILRRAGLREREEWAVVGTDVILDRGREFLKPLLIGLPNRHNVLFDLERNRVAAWYLGDAARQRTKGKTWYWETGGGPHAHLVNEPGAGSELTLAIAGQRLEPLAAGQFPTELDAWRHVEGGVSWRQRLRFASPGDEASPTVIHVEQTILPRWRGEGSESGFRRTVTISGVPTNAEVVFRVRPEREFHEDGQVQLVSPAITVDEEGTAVAKPSDGSGRVVLELEYLTQREPDTFPAEPEPLPPPSPTPMFVAPGFDAMQLPLPEEIMPTALAWTPQGTLVVASLKGRVWLARDTDGDRLEDKASPFSDDLAAPYGLATARTYRSSASGEKASPGPRGAAGPGETTYVDVANKYAVLRLFDDDGDGRAERTETLASGWGHTTDYHDWAVGLPSDDQGNYYLALPCQQDDRSPAAAHLRGHVLRLAPRAPTSDDPRRFLLESLSAGHRFPMGIARNRDGDLFVTDNQGNYNPFNELNHVVAGRRYGFINKLEQKPGFSPPLTPPAVDLPHPWTRSVNGICFLDTPPAVRERLGRDAFGPFEGHLVGCEMNNKLLVRMTLHRVGDVLQGAVYPLSYDQPREGAAFLGPLCAEVSPEGDLYVGSLLDSGWGGGNNIGSLVRMRPTPEELPAGIREVRAEPAGLVVEFTQPVDRRRASERANYSLASYTRISTPAYGGNDVNRRNEAIQSLRVAEDGTSVVLELAEWREGYVYELHLKNIARGDQEFFPAEAHYTLRQAPSAERASGE